MLRRPEPYRGPWIQPARCELRPATSATASSKADQQKGAQRQDRDGDVAKLVDPLGRARRRDPTRRGLGFGTSRQGARPARRGPHRKPAVCGSHRDDDGAGQEHADHQEDEAHRDVALHQLVDSRVDERDAEQDDAPQDQQVHGGGSEGDQSHGHPERTRLGAPKPPPQALADPLVIPGRRARFRLMHTGAGGIRPADGFQTSDRRVSQCDDGGREWPSPPEGIASRPAPPSRRRGREAAGKRLGAPDQRTRRAIESRRPARPRPSPACAGSEARPTGQAAAPGTGPRAVGP